MDHGRWRTVALAVAVAMAASIPAAAGPERCAVETRLHWIDVVSLASFAYRGMASEATDVLGRHGVCAEVVRAAPSSVRGADGEIGVVLLRSIGPAGSGKRVMGSIRPGSTTNPSVWIFFDEVAAAVGLSAREPETWTASQRADFARALGRVAAHEVVHALLPDRPHDPSGLMAATLKRHELTRVALPANPGLLADVRRAGPQRLASIAHGGPQGDGGAGVHR
jgi:hypothetical protein